MLSGTSTTAREGVLRCLLRGPGLLAVDYRLDAGGPALGRRVVWTHVAVVEDVPVGENGCCLACAVHDVIAHLVPAVAAGHPARLAATVVDAPLLLAHLSGDDLLADRGLAGHSAPPSDGREGNGCYWALRWPSAELVLVSTPLELHRQGQLHRSRQDVLDDRMMSTHR